MKVIDYKPLFKEGQERSMPVDERAFGADGAEALPASY
jgi:hypothetical protein